MADNDTNATFPQGSSVCTVLICTMDDGAAVAELIFESLTAAQLSVVVENLSKADTTCSVAKCTVFVPILTPQLEQALVCRAACEQARLLRKPVVSVLAVKKWRPVGWLGLIIAGRIFFRIFDQETAYKPFYDSNRITDLRVEIEVSKFIYYFYLYLMFERLHVYQLQVKLNVKTSRKKHLKKRLMNVKVNYQHGHQSANLVLSNQWKIDNLFGFNYQSHMLIHTSNIRIIR
jgi:hypothetical protein